MTKVIEFIAQQIPVLIALYVIWIVPKRREKKDRMLKQDVLVGDKIISRYGLCGKVYKTSQEYIYVLSGPDNDQFSFKRDEIYINESLNKRKKELFDNSTILGKVKIMLWN